MQKHSSRYSHYWHWNRKLNHVWGYRGYLTKAGRSSMKRSQVQHKGRQALIIAAQKVEHYEMTSYGSLVTLAKTLKQTEIAGFTGVDPGRGKTNR